MYLSIKEMRYSKGRYALIISVIALISYLVYFLLALAYGLSSDNRTALDQWHASGYVLTDASNENLVVSTFDKEWMNQIAAPEKAALNVARSVVYINGDKSDDGKADVVFFGVDDTSFLAPNIIEGVKGSDPMDAIVSISMKEEQGINIGDTLEISQTGRVFKVTGFTEDVKYNTSPVVYVTLEQASAPMMNYIPTDGVDGITSATPNMPDRISAVVVKGLEEGATISNLHTDLLYIPSDTLIQKLPGYTAQVLTFSLMIGFLVLIATIIIGIFMYIFTMQKKTVFGVMKAQGIPTKIIGLSVVWQSLFVTLLGIGIGLGLTLVSGVALPAKVPFSNNSLFYIAISVVTLLFSLLGSLLSVKLVTKIDPLDALK